MAGQLTTNYTIKQANPALANAFSLGRDAYIAGSGSNPYTVGSEYYAAWAAGNTTTSPQGQRDSATKCIPIVMPNLVGMTSAAAQTAILTANLIVGKITGSTGVVTVQSPVSAAKAQPQDVVTFTIV